ncbi:MAG TPA: sigma-70 family RNA polymerase sigma factor [Chitinophagaceae bacterium]|nr:sigma-70 family RNA polymerase sigma factor [Chitinophagaceae bacterium]
MDKQTIFRQWMTDHADVLYRYSLRCLNDEELCKDMVQETFLAAWRNMDTYRSEASVKNWLFVILKSKITDHFRKSHTQLVDSIKQEHNDHTFFDEQDHWRKGVYPKQWSVDFSNQVETKEFYKVFQSCGKKLKELQNTVFVMKYVDGLDSEDICKELALSPSNYWVLIHRAKVQLRACLEKNWMRS